MPGYASGTDVTIDRTRVEIERVLMRYGVSEFGYMANPKLAMVGFRFNGLPYRIEVPTPDPGAVEFTHTAAGKRRSQDAARKEWENEVRRRWRVLLLLIKAKLEAVAAGTSSVEREFLADLVLPNRQTMWEWAGQEVRPALTAGRMPQSILALPGPAAGGAESN